MMERHIQVAVALADIIITRAMLILPPSLVIFAAILIAIEWRER